MHTLVPCFCRSSTSHQNTASIGQLALHVRKILITHTILLELRPSLLLCIVNTCFVCRWCFWWEKSSYQMTQKCIHKGHQNFKGVSEYQKWCCLVKPVKMVFTFTSPSTISKFLWNFAPLATWGPSHIKGGPFTTERKCKERTLCARVRFKPRLTCKCNVLTGIVVMKLWLGKIKRRLKRRDGVQLRGIPHHQRRYRRGELWFSREFRWSVVKGWVQIPVWRIFHKGLLTLHCYAFILTQNFTSFTMLQSIP